MWLCLATPCSDAGPEWLAFQTPASVCYRATFGELAIQSQMAALCTEAVIAPLHEIGPRIKEVRESQVRAMESTRNPFLSAAPARWHADLRQDSERQNNNHPQALSFREASLVLTRDLLMYKTQH